MGRNLTAGDGGKDSSSGSGSNSVMAQPQSQKKYQTLKTFLPFPGIFREVEKQEARNLEGVVYRMPSIYRIKISSECDGIVRIENKKLNGAGDRAPFSTYSWRG